MLKPVQMILSPNNARVLGSGTVGGGITGGTTGGGGGLPPNS